MASGGVPAGRSGRGRDADRTRAEILDAATQEFARAGYAGARIDEIAARTRTTKRMIYYFFGGKEQLFTAVLERAHGMIRVAEQRLDVAHLDPVAAVRRLAQLTFDQHEQHPDLIRLVSIDPGHGAGRSAASERPATTDSPALDAIRRILAAGRARGVFRAGADAVDVYAMIRAFCFLRVAGRPGYGPLSAHDPADPVRRERHRALLADMVIAYLAAERTRD
ncbi:TetR/AcrR family transcriptional regulator [Streptomyces sp. NPDC002514]|uniref:TetR/AcrR family transcriptional regulator n=1 Tax=Streptomyces sp. NPDC001270 TaxID=3364554 RepID=UPI00369F9C6A